MTAREVGCDHAGVAFFALRLEHKGFQRGVRKLASIKSNRRPAALGRAVT
jgi:hypothetical protein